MSDSSMVIVNKAAMSESEDLRARGFSGYAQGLAMRIGSAGEEELAAIAKELREETVLAASQVAEREEALFERLILMFKHRLYLQLGWTSMREFILKDLGKVLAVHRSTMFLLAGALEERERLEGEFGDVKASWRVLARLAPERKRQEGGKGLLPLPEFEELKERAAKGQVTQNELYARLKRSTEAAEPPPKRTERKKRSCLGNSPVVPLEEDDDDGGIDRALEDLVVGGLTSVEGDFHGRGGGVRRVSSRLADLQRAMQGVPVLPLEEWSAVPVDELEDLERAAREGATVLEEVAGAARAAIAYVRSTPAELDLGDDDELIDEDAIRESGIG